MSVPVRPSPAAHTQNTRVTRCTRDPAGSTPEHGQLTAETHCIHSLTSTENPEVRYQLVSKTTIIAKVELSYVELLLSNTPNYFQICFIHALGTRSKNNFSESWIIALLYIKHTQHYRSEVTQQNSIPL